MKVVVLHGSARTGGDTDTLADQVLLGVREAGPLEEIHFRPIEMSIAHCRACMGCIGEAGCVIDDDMRAVYPAFSAADIVVIASPMFWGYMTSQLKTLFDRLEAIVDPKNFQGKDFVLLIGYRHYYGSMIEWLDRISTGFGSRSHSLACRTYDPETDQDLPVASNPTQQRQARDLGRRVALLRGSSGAITSRARP